MRKKTFFIIISLILIMILMYLWPEATASTKENLQDKKELEVQVEQLLKGDNVSLRRDVDKVFLLADIYASEGNDKDAIRFYEKALQVDGWRLEYQLKFAHLLNKHKDKIRAIEKAKLVYEYAEDESTIKQAEDFLFELGVKSIRETKETAAFPINENIEIVMVPIGKVNKRLLFEVRDELQKKMGIKYSIAENGLDLGAIDRSYADRYLTEIAEEIMRQLPREKIEELLAYTKLAEPDLKTQKGKVKFINGYFDKTATPKEEIQQFWYSLEELKGKGQFDASRLLSELKKGYILGTKSELKGYLGITEGDIFADDDNYLFGWAGMGYGVISYHRFRAEFNDEPPNRPRLRTRTAKQAISSSFFIIKIPRCTTPTCVRTYPHSLIEHDQKSYELCSWCKEQLNNYIKSH